MLFLSAIVATALAFGACSSSDSTPEPCTTTTAGNTFDITIFGFAEFLPASVVSLNTVENNIEVAAANSFFSVASQFVSIGLPANATTGTYTSADSATMFYAENFNFADGTSTLSYGSTSPRIAVFSAGGVGCLWTGTFDSGDMALLGGVGAVMVFASGEFSIVREVDGFTE